MIIEIPDLLRIEPIDQDSAGASPSRQIRDLTIDLGINTFLRLVFGKSAVAASLPGYRNLNSLLKNPYAHKSVVSFRQEMFHEIFQRKLEDPLDRNAGKLSFCSSPIEPETSIM